MNRNVESRFALNPTHLDMPRSRFVMTQDHKTTGNIGSIYPFYRCEVLPGDTFNVTTSLVFRLQTLITPMMDNIYLDTYYFFIPYRLVWDHWKEFMGENSSSAWLPSVQYTIPQITSPSSTGWTVGSLADHFGIPTGVTDLSISSLPFRAYALVMDQWFRDENLTDPLNIPTGDSTQTGTNGSSYINDVANGGAPFLASKYHDVFTSALPAPQKGPDVRIPLGVSSPVFTGDENLYPYTGTPDALHFKNVNGTAITNGSVSVKQSSNQTIGNAYTQSGSISSTELIYPSNLYADLTQATGSSINQLRQAFQIQKFYEAQARGGSRYIELIRECFGVTSPDARLQRTEYLGGKRIPLNINQVVQTSESNTTPMGDVAAYSLTSDVHEDFTQSFTEHGIVLGVMVARYDHSYQQGIEKMWSRKTRLDFYWPVLSSIGEMPIKNKEIYAQGSSVINPTTGIAYDEEVFGYQEPWFEYRYTPNFITGEMRSSYAASLDMWHLADDYSSMPYLSDTWIREDKSNVDRALAVTSSVSNQFFCDIYVKNVATRPLPVYGIPGLIDHH